MHGTNVQRQLIWHKTGELELQEVFHTLQGEGPLTGTPAVFVRLAGCNLACTFCDTDFESAYAKHPPGTGARWPNVAEVAEEVYMAAQPSTRLMVITGGEPLRQDVLPLIEAVMSDRRHKIRTVQIETSGSITPANAPILEHLAKLGEVVFVVSPKTPKVQPFFHQLGALVHWKYIMGLGDRHPVDGLPYKSTQPKHVRLDATDEEVAGTEEKRPRIARPSAAALTAGTVWVSPRDDGDHDPHQNNVQEAVQACLVHGYRLSLQTHKLLGLP